MYNVNVGGGNPLDSEIKSIESQIQHVMMMMSNPQLTPQMRMQFQMQLPSLTIQLNHLQQMSLYGGDPYMNVGGMGMAAAAMGVPGGQGGYNNMYADGMGYGAQGYSSGHVFNNPGLLSGKCLLRGPTFHRSLSLFFQTQTPRTNVLPPTIVGGHRNEIDRRTLST